MTDSLVKLTVTDQKVDTYITAPSEQRDGIDLQQLALDRESSMTTLTKGEQQRLL